MSDGLTPEGAPAWWKPGRSGPPGEAPGVILRRAAGRRRFLLEARRGRAGALAARLAERFGAAPADAPRASPAGGVLFLGVGPARWHVLIPDDDEPLADALAAAAQGLAAALEVTHGFAVVSVEGRCAAEALSTLGVIDFRERVFPRGACVATILAGVDAQVRRLDGAGAYECAVARSFGASFHDALVRAATPRGLLVEDAPP